MSDYRFTLDKRKPRRKYACPSCGHRRCFTRYIDTEGIIVFPDEVGLCDRLNNCGYHYSPRDYFRDHPEALAKPWNAIDIHRPKPVVAVQPQPPSLIDHSLVSKTLGHYDRNPLFQYLSYVFGEEEALRLCREYCVGTSRKWGGSTVFWQIDIAGRVRAGKIMAYDPRSGHRIKSDGRGRVCWTHSELRIDSFNLRQCLFGEHLLARYPDRTAMITESEKTAIIASHFLTDYVWLATGGMGNLRQSDALRGRDVILCPDLGATDRWRAKASELSSVCRSVKVYDFLDRIASSEALRKGYDIADYLLRDPTPHKVWSDMKAANPALAELERDLDLHLVGFDDSC